MKIRVQHLHDGNSTRKQRHNSKYITVASVVDDHGNVYDTAVARCNKSDTPSRKTGRMLALSRLAVSLAQHSEPV